MRNDCASLVSFHASNYNPMKNLYLNIKEFSNNSKMNFQLPQKIDIFQKRGNEPKIGPELALTNSDGFA